MDLYAVPLPRKAAMGDDTFAALAMMVLLRIAGVGKASMNDTAAESAMPMIFVGAGATAAEGRR